MLFLSSIKKLLRLCVYMGENMINQVLHDIYVTNLLNIFVAIPVLLLVWSVIGATFYKYMRFVGTVMAVIVIGAILYITVSSRSERDVAAELIPFSSFTRAKLQPEFYRTMLMNVFLFVPLGMPLPFMFGCGTGKRILFTVLVGFLLSLTVEATQYFARLGMAEADDVICNTVGAAVGSCSYLLSLLWRKLLFKTKGKEKV